MHKTLEQLEVERDQAANELAIAAIKATLAFVQGKASIEIKRDVPSYNTSIRIKIDDGAH